MTTTENLRDYLDAHGSGGPPTEPGWHVVECEDRDVVFVLVERAPHGMAIRMGGEGGAGMFRTDCARHAPLILALPTGRDLDAETVAGVQAAREVVVRVVPGPQFDDMVRKMAGDDLRGLAGKGAT